jgi:hypothetical protein
MKKVKKIVTNQPMEISLLMLISTKWTNASINQWRKTKRNQSPTIKENFFREVCQFNFNKDGY